MGKDGFLDVMNPKASGRWIYGLLGFKCPCFTWKRGLALESGHLYSPGKKKERNGVSSC
jgi:hypothetical protein